jgi:LysR family glycine cleavage system transcriptional activator
MDDRLPPLTTLRAFESAARHVSFSRAAQELHLTPAAISHQVKALEQRLQVALFERQPNGLVLTQAGQAYRAAIGDALGMIAKATGRLALPSLEGPLRIATTQSFALFWLVPRLHRFTALYPLIDLMLHADTRHIEVGTGLTDVALKLGTGRYPGLQSTLLMNDAVTPVATPSIHDDIRRTSLRDVLQQVTLLEDYTIGANEPWMTWPQWLRELRVDRAQGSTRLRFSDSGLVTQACLAGAGIGLARVSFVQQALAEQRLVALAPPRTTEFAHYVVVHPADEENPRVAVFCNWLQAEVTDYLAGLDPVLRLALAP